MRLTGAVMLFMHRRIKLPSTNLQLLHNPVVGCFSLTLYQSELVATGKPSPRFSLEAEFILLFQLCHFLSAGLPEQRLPVILKLKSACYLLPPVNAEHMYLSTHDF